MLGAGQPQRWLTDANGTDAPHPQHRRRLPECEPSPPSPSPANWCGNVSLGGWSFEGRRRYATWPIHAPQMLEKLCEEKLRTSSHPAGDGVSDVAPLGNLPHARPLRTST